MTLECQVCHKEHNTPIDLQFDFRLNEFFATCLREHDTLSVVWALGELQHRSRATSFIFSPQMELFRKYPEGDAAQPDREIDLLCVIDGKVVIGEVKASLAEIDQQEIDKLIAVAKEIQPDIVLIAAMKGEEEKLNQKLGEVRNRASLGIEVKGFLGDKNYAEHYLP